MDDIEISHFERVRSLTKNFDLVLISKDFQNFKRICSIPNEQLEMIKNWLDSINIVYSEGPMCLNWANILGHIRGDFEGFVNDGGWSFILDQN